MITRSKIKTLQRITEVSFFTFLISFALSCDNSASKKKSSGSSTAASSDASASLDGGGSKQQMIAKANELKSQISGRYAELQRERDRQGKLTSELLNQTADGCFANVKIEKLELLVKGSWLPRKPLGKTGSPLPGTGNPSTVTFQFGESIAVVNDEKTNSMFHAAGRKVITDYSELKISDIEFIRVSKGGAGILSERKCESSAFGFSEDCDYQNFETDRYELDELEVKINGETFYKRSGIAAQMENGKLDWNEDGLKVNEYWLKLMQREDCPQGQ